ncbi:MAG: tetratricopeptide repeat protein, partial [Candidatus Sericytochromatia bacterium]
NVASGESKALGKVTGSVGQIFSLQDQLVSQILSAHGVNLAPAQQQALQQQLTLTQKPEAYAVYVQALGSEESDNPATSGNALAQLDQAIALDGNFAEAYHHRALLHLRKHDFVRARADLDAAIRLNPKDGGMYFARGRLLLEQKQPQAALADLDKAVALQPSLAQAWNSRGQAWLALQQSDKALADFNRALELDPSHYFALLNRAEAYGRGKAWQQAQQDLSRATRLFPRRPAAFALSGQLFEAQGRCREAHEAWQKACKLGLRKLCRQRCKG